MGCVTIMDMGHVTITGHGLYNKYGYDHVTVTGHGLCNNYGYGQCNSYWMCN